MRVLLHAEGATAISNAVANGTSVSFEGFITGDAGMGRSQGIELDQTDFDVDVLRGNPVQESDYTLMSVSPVSGDEFIIRCLRHEDVEFIRVANITLYGKDASSNVFPLFYCANEDSLPLFEMKSNEAGSKYSFYIRVRWPGITDLFDFSDMHKLIPEIPVVPTEWELPEIFENQHNVTMLSNHTLLNRPQLVITRYNNQYWGCPLMEQLDTQNSQPKQRVIISGGVVGDLYH